MPRYEAIQRTVEAYPTDDGLSVVVLDWPGKVCQSCWIVNPVNAETCQSCDKRFPKAKKK